MVKRNVLSSRGSIVLLKVCPLGGAVHIFCTIIDSWMVLIKMRNIDSHNWYTNWFSFLRMVEYIKISPKVLTTMGSHHRATDLWMVLITMISI